MESLLPVLLIPTVSLPSPLVWESNVLKMDVKAKSRHDEQKRAGHFMVAASIRIAHSHPGINRRLSLVRNVSTPLWSKSGKRTKNPQLFVPNVDLKRPTQQPDIFS